MINITCSTYNSFSSFLRDFDCDLIYSENKGVVSTSHVMLLNPSRQKENYSHPGLTMSWNNTHTHTHTQTAKSLSDSKALNSL